MLVLLYLKLQILLLKKVYAVVIPFNNTRDISNLFQLQRYHSIRVYQLYLYSSTTGTADVD